MRVLRSGRTTSSPLTSTVRPALSPFTFIEPNVPRRRTFSWSRKSTHAFPSRAAKSSSRKWRSMSLWRPIEAPIPQSCAKPGVAEIPATTSASPSTLRIDKTTSRRACFDSTRCTDAAPYRGSARSILLAFKFRAADYLGPRLAQVVVGRLAREETLSASEVTAVPATARAVRRRGYHPAELLAEAVAKELGLSFSP